MVKISAIANINYKINGNVMDRKLKVIYFQLKMHNY